MAPFLNKIFSITSPEMENLCLEIFYWQYQHNLVYRQWCQSVGIKTAAVQSIQQIPFLPVSLYKSQKITSTLFLEEKIFKSSGTTRITNSIHYIKDIKLYEQSFATCFQQFYGKPEDYCIIGLLPSYLEQGHSSLVYMTDALIKQSKNVYSGFYLHDYEALNNTLLQLQKLQQQTLLIGVTYALLDFAAAFPQPLRNTIVMETGGMKGRRTEITRAEIHAKLKNAFSLESIHSEYGMTELLSQAYSKGNGLFNTPNWMKVLIRQEDDPFAVTDIGRGLLNIIDLANIYSCCFIAVDDWATIHPDGSFEVIGRRDNSDLRGCSLLTIN